MTGLVKELYAYRSMISNLVRRDLRGRYKGSLLGFLWNFILPLIQILVYIMVFTIVFRQNIEHYYIYLIVGMVPWMMFSDSLSCGAGSVVENSSLVSKIYFPRIIIPISVVISKTINFFISMAIAFVVIGVGGHGFAALPLLTLPIAILFLFVFSLGLAMACAALNVFMRDVQYLVSVLLMVYIWLTPIMYVKDFVENDLFVRMLELNPLTYIIGLFQDILYWKVVPTLLEFLEATAIAFAALAIGVYVYDRMSADFAEVL